MIIRTTLLSASLLLATSLSLSAQDEATAQLETALKRMRDTLRTTTVRLQTAEAERGTAQAALAESEKKNKDLEAKLAALTKAADADKADAEKQIASLVNKVGNQGEDLKRLNESLAKWKAGYEKIVTQAKAIEAQRASLAVEKARLERLVADRERKNLELFQVGNEILTRYKKFGLGTAISAREPFTGITRVRLEGLVQDYADKLEDGRIQLSEEEKKASPAKPETEPATTPAPAPEAKSKVSKKEAAAIQKPAPVEKTQR
jgi:chromosome segregation ATPase